MASRADTLARAPSACICVHLRFQFLASPPPARAPGVKPLRHERRPHRLPRPPLRGRGGGQRSARRRWRSSSASARPGKISRVFIQAARDRGEALDHVLLHGPPGLGKTTLAQIVARELGVGFRATSGPVIQRAGDLAAILTNLQPRDVLFIDEIHRLQPAIEEVLYPAMEDFQLDLIIGEGPAARSVRIDLPPFTLVGATTRAGLLATPLRDRFGIPLRLVFYTPEELRADRHPRRPEAGRRTDRRRAPRRSPAAPAARRASPAACCAGCATSPRCTGDARSTARSPMPR